LRHQRTIGLSDPPGKWHARHALTRLPDVRTRSGLAVAADQTPARARIAEVHEAVALADADFRILPNPVASLGRSQACEMDEVQRRNRGKSRCRFARKR